MTERKTTRKNQTNLVMNWPTNSEYFTIQSLCGMNPNFKNITLRVRLKKALEEEKTVQEIGYKNLGKGRPIKAFALTPLSQTALDMAVKDGITLSTSVTVLEVNPTVTVASNAAFNVNKNVVVNNVTTTVKS